MSDILRRFVIVATLFLLGAGQACACISHSPASPGLVAAVSHNADHHHGHGEPDAPDAKCCDGKNAAIQSEPLIHFKADRIAKPAPALIEPISAILGDQWAPAPAVAPPRLPAPRAPTLLELKIRLQN